MSFAWFLLSLFLCDVVWAETKSDGGKAPRIQLNDGHAIPHIGLGTFLGFDEKGQKQAKEKEVENAVSWALNSGYRLLDTASAYHNEEQVGRGVVQSSVPREDVYLVTKLGLNEQRTVVESLRNSLKRLNMSYVDLYLIHNPVAFTPDHSGFDVVDYLDTWKSMEEAKNLGLAKSIGISNFNISQIERLLANSQIKPAVLQVEVNLNLAQDKLLEFCKKHNIAVMGYTPFGSLFDKGSEAPAPRADHPILKELAQKYKKTTPQIVLRYLVQRGVIPIPKSVKEERIKENVEIFDFQLDEAEIELLSKFNKDYRVVWPTFWQNHPYYPFEKSDKHAKNPFEGVKNE